MGSPPTGAVPKIAHLEQTEFDQAATHVLETVEGHPSAIADETLMH